MSDTTDRFIGKVKWFNNKSGFGFITVSSESDFKDKDIFVHYSAINTTDNQYKYLVQGEYIEFEITSTINGDHEHQATNISGILGGDIMCETRRLNRPPDDKRRSSNNGDNNEDEEGFAPVLKKRSARPPRDDKSDNPPAVYTSSSSEKKRSVPRRTRTSA
jgi:CspA family cold shock protein